MLQVLTWVLSYDGEQSPEPLAITAAGAALAVSGNPFLQMTALWVWSQLLSQLQRGTALTSNSNITVASACPGDPSLQLRKKRQEKTTPFGVDLTRSLVIYQAACLQLTTMWVW